MRAVDQLPPFDHVRLNGEAETALVDRDRALGEARSEAEAARASRDRAQRRAYVANILAAELAIQTDDVANARRLLVSSPYHLRRWEGPFPR